MQCRSALQLVLFSRLVIRPRAWSIIVDRLCKSIGEHSHLLASVDETLLNRGNAFLLFHPLLDARNLTSKRCEQGGTQGAPHPILGSTNLVVGFNVKFNLLAGERSYSVSMSAKAGDFWNHPNSFPYLICILNWDYGTRRRRKTCAKCKYNFGWAVLFDLASVLSGGDKMTMFVPPHHMGVPESAQ